MNFNVISQPLNKGMHAYSRFSAMSFAIMFGDGRFS